MSPKFLPLIKMTLLRKLVKSVQGELRKFSAELILFSSLAELYSILLALTSFYPHPSLFCSNPLHNPNVQFTEDVFWIGTAIHVFEIDTYWVQAGGANPVDWIRPFESLEISLRYLEKYL